MRGMKLALTCVAALVLVAAAPMPFWGPSPAQIARLEMLVKPTGQIRALAKYERAYAGTTVSGRKMIEGRWISPNWNARPQARSPQIVPFGSLPEILDGGCSVVTVMYDVQTDKILLLQCNGVA